MKNANAQMQFHFQSIDRMKIIILKKENKLIIDKNAKFI